MVLGFLYDNKWTYQMITQKSYYILHRSMIRESQLNYQKSMI